MHKFFLIALFSIIAGAIGVLAYSPFDISFFAFITFISLILIVICSPKKSALFAFLWGFGYFLAGVHWVYVSIKQYGNLPEAAAICILLLFIGYLSLYPFLFAYILKRAERWIPKYSAMQFIIVVPILWQITEYIRGSLLNGFAWLQFGYTQLDSALFNGYFAIIGSDGVNLLFSIACGICAYLMFNGYQLVKNKKYKPVMHHISAVFALLMIFLTSVVLSYAEWTNLDKSRSVKIALLQGNIAQSLKWDKNAFYNTLEMYKKMTLKAIKNNDVVILPEVAITDFEANQQSFLKALDAEAKKNNSAVALGILDVKKNDNDYNVFNNLLVLGDDQNYTYYKKQQYSKQHLVPFGEYTPLSFLFAPIAKMLNVPMSSMKSGQANQKPLVMNGYTFTPAICYEIILTNLVLNNFTPDSDFLLTVSNDAWFGNTIGPQQHLQMARARALELGRTLIRSTNNGITAVINHKGYIEKRIPQFEQNTLEAKLSPTKGVTPYAEFKKTFCYFILIIMAVILFFNVKNRKWHKYCFIRIMYLQYERIHNSIINKIRGR